MRKFLNTPERRTCRYDSRYTSLEISGLYTDNFSECNIVILFKQDELGIKMSMTHADKIVRPRQIQDELEWIGQNARAVIVARDIPTSKIIRQQALGFLENKFDIQYCKQEDFALSLDKQGSISFYTRENVPLLVTHPQEWWWQSIFILNLTFTTYEPQITQRKLSPTMYAPPNYGALRSTALIFDGASWQSLSESDQVLCGLAAKFMTYLEEVLVTTNNSSRSFIMPLINEFFKERGYLTVIPDPDKLLLLTHGLLYITRNNYQKLFNDELQHIYQRMLQQKAAKSDIALVSKVINETKDDFEIFSKFIDAVNRLQSPPLTNSLKGIYKICVRLKQHAAGVLDLAQPRNVLTLSTSS
jgi:hypothetical protein